MHPSVARHHLTSLHHASHRRQKLAAPSPPHLRRGDSRSHPLLVACQNRRPHPMERHRSPRSTSPRPHRLHRNQKPPQTQINPRTRSIKSTTRRCLLSLPSQKPRGAPSSRGLIALRWECTNSPSQPSFFFPPHKHHHFDRSCPQFYRGQRSGETRFSKQHTHSILKALISFYPSYHRYAVVLKSVAIREIRGRF